MVFSKIYDEITNSLEFAIFIVFLLEYLIRISCCTAYGKSLKRFILEPMNIVGIIKKNNI